MRQPAFTFALLAVLVLACDPPRRCQEGERGCDAQAECSTDSDCASAESCEAGQCVETVTCETDAGACQPDAGVDECELTASTTALDFQTVTVGAEATLPVTLTNAGTRDCTVEETGVTSGAESAFSVESPLLPYLLPPGEERDLRVRFRPVTSGGHHETLTVRGGGQQLDIALSGEATSMPRCRLTLSPKASTTLDFGTVEVGTSPRLSVALTNSGSDACTFSNARLIVAPGSVASAFAIRSLPQSPLAPGATATMELAFVPSSSDVYGAAPPLAPTVAVFLDTNDAEGFPQGECSMAGSPTGEAGCIAWGLSGVGEQTGLAVLPSQIDFGSVRTGCSSTPRSVVVRNVVTDNVTIAGVMLEAPTLPSSFALSDVQTPTTLMSGDEQQFTVDFAPTTTGHFLATLSVTANETGAANGTRVYSIPLAGEGTASATRSDRWLQEPNPKIDVLFVVDDSGSMTEEQKKLAAQTPAFVEAANAANADYQFGVVTTDTEATTATRGALLGTPKIIRPGATAANQLATTIKAAGTYGSGIERGLEAMQLALSAPLVTAANAGFLRPDARLAVVVLSDEEDYSSQNATSSFVDFLDNLKGIGNANRTSLSAIVGPEGDCSWEGGYADDGARYRAVQEATGGHFISICEEDWSDLVELVAQDSFRPRSRFPLSEPANAASVGVTLNGVASMTGWTFDAVDNEVVFAPSAIPTAGTEIVVSYETACL